MSAYKRALSRIIKDPRNRFTAVELADVAECSTRHFYAVCDVRNQSAQLKTESVERLGQFLSENNEQRVSLCFIHESKRIEDIEEAHADGRIEDEIRDIVVLVGQWAEEMKGDSSPDKIHELTAKIRSVVDRIDVESSMKLARVA